MMNKLKLLEAMNLIDDDLLNDTETLSGDAKKAENAGDTEPGITVSGVDIYRRGSWQRVTAVAATLVLAAGLTFAGMHFLRNRSPVDTDKNIISTENTSGAGDENEGISASTGEQNTETSAAPTDTDGSIEAVTAAETTLNSGTAQETTSPALSGRQDTTDAKTTTAPAKTTAARTTSTIAKTDAPVTTTAPFPEMPASGRMTLSLLKRYAEFGDSLTWGDFKGYEHEDVGSGVFVWEIPVYDDDKQDGEAEFTLVMNCMTGEDSEKPGIMALYYGEQKYNKEYIDIRTDSITDFVIKCRRKEGDPDYLNYILGNIKDCHVDYIRSIELSHPMYNYPVYLSYSEIKEMLPMIQKLTFTKSVGDEWRYLDGSNIHIKLTDNKGTLHEYDLVGSKYFAVNGTGYEAPYSNLLALDTYALSVIGKHKPSDPVDVKGVWCWHDTSEESISARDLSESITLKQFPDYVFSWNGMKRQIEGYNIRNRCRLASVTTMGQAYFADINGDGYPELCTTYDWGLSSRIIGELAVYDIHNGRVYTMNDPENEMIYWLYEDGGELRVNRQPATNNYSPNQKKGEQGRLRITNNTLEFVKV